MICPNRLLLACALALGLSLATTGGAFALSSGSSSSSTTDSRDLYADAEEAIEDGDYPAAIGLLKEVIAEDDGNADVLNLLGFSNRKLGDFAVAFDYYQRALSADPDHRGANEYLGELYVQMGNVAAAEGQLETLEGLCGSNCEESEALMQAIAAKKTGD
jgi:Tfp pilus assembly protein PilF